jgi:hypothetical protein
MVGSIVITIKSPSTRPIITSFALISTEHNALGLIPSELYDNLITIIPITLFFIVIFGVMILLGLIFKDKILFSYYYNLDKFNIFLRNFYICIYIISLLINYFLIVGFDVNQNTYYYLSELDLNNIAYFDTGNSSSGGSDPSGSGPGGFGGSDPSGSGPSGSGPSGSGSNGSNGPNGPTNNGPNDRITRIGNCEHPSRSYVYVGKYDRCDFVGNRGIGHSAAYNSNIAGLCVHCRALFCADCDITRSGN